MLARTHRIPVLNARQLGSAVSTLRRAIASARPGDSTQPHDAVYVSDVLCFLTFASPPHLQRGADHSLLSPVLETAAGTGHIGVVVVDSAAVVFAEDIMSQAKITGTYVRSSFDRVGLRGGAGLQAKDNV